jgi:ribonuclease Z
MELTFLGTGSAAPTPRRNLPALAVKLPDRREIWLFDCGEGTQHRLMGSGVRSSQIRRILISHLHGDHLYGLPGLLGTLSLQGGVRELDLYGPPGLAELVETTARISATRYGFALACHRLVPGLVHAEPGFTLSCLPLEHGTPSFGFRLVEDPRPGRFHPERAAARGIPPGPIYARLKMGEEVELADGRRLRGEDFCELPEPGRVIAICSDTVPCAAAVELARGSDLLVHEATFGDAHRDLAPRRGHSTAAQAAEIARQAGTRRLVLTHFSGRYQQEAGPSVADLLREAQQIFPATEAAEDLMTFSVARPRRGVPQPAGAGS